MHTRCDPSPDGAFAILEELRRPFSYEIPCGRFPKRVWVVNRAGETVREVADLPLADEIPIVHNACRAGPRGVNWRPDKPAELYWTEARDGGDPRVEASPRDVTYVADMHDAGAGRGGRRAVRDGPALRRRLVGRGRARDPVRVLVQDAHDPRLGRGHARARGPAEAAPLRPRLRGQLRRARLAFVAAHARRDVPARADRGPAAEGRVEKPREKKVARTRRRARTARRRRVCAPSRRRAGRRARRSCWRATARATPGTSLFWICSTSTRGRRGVCGSVPV